MSDGEVRVAWFCCNFVGPARWKMSGDWVLEPDECSTEFETVEDRETWDEGCCSAECPSCGRVLNQSDGEAELAREKGGAAAAPG